MSPDPFLAINLGDEEKFQVLDSTNSPFPTIYTWVSTEITPSIIRIHCTFKDKQGKQEFTGTTWFLGKTKIVKYKPSYSSLHNQKEIV